MKQYIPLLFFIAGVLATGLLICYFGHKNKLKYGSFYGQHPTVFYYLPTGWATFRHNKDTFAFSFYYLHDCLFLGHAQKTDKGTIILYLQVYDRERNKIRIPESEYRTALNFALDKLNNK